MTEQVPFAWQPTQASDHGPISRWIAVRSARSNDRPSYRIQRSTVGHRGSAPSPRLRASTSNRRRRRRGPLRLLLLQDALVVGRHHLHELRLHLVPAVEGVGGDGAAGQPVVLLISSFTSATSSASTRSSSSTMPRLQSSGRRRGPGPRRRRPRPTCRPRSCRPVGPRITTRPPVMYSQPWSPTPSITVRARVADAEPLGRPAAEVRLAAGGAVQADVADEDLLLRLEGRFAWRVDDHAAAREALADVVVGVALEFERHAVREERAEALAGVAVELEVDRAVGQALFAVPLGDLVRQDRADGPVRVDDRHLSR